MEIIGNKISELFLLGGQQMEKFIVKKNGDSTETITVRLDKNLLSKYDELAKETNRSRNALITMALQFALDNLVIE